LRGDNRETLPRSVIRIRVPLTTEMWLQKEKHMILKEMNEGSYVYKCPESQSLYIKF